MSTDTTTRLVQAVYDHALANYESGWDMVVETMGEVEIAKIIAGCRSANGAIKRLQFHVDLWVERQANAGVPEAMHELELGRQDAEREVYEGLAPENVDPAIFGVGVDVDADADVLSSPLGDHLPGFALYGPVCGACTSELHRPGTTRLQVRHATIAAVRLCAQRRVEHDEDLAREQEANADSQVELAHERYLENGGRHAEAISIDLEEERRREGW